MKKAIIILMGLALAMFLVGPAMAGVAGTAHENVAADGGACGACHIPHGASGDRLWVKAPYTGAPPANITGAVAVLCAYCHNTGGGATTSYPGAASDTQVYGANSHGVLMSVATAGIPRSYVPSGLPYHADANDGIIECTTCHNVHDDPTANTPGGFRPFLRADMDTLCIGCHNNRMFNDGVDFSGAAAVAETVMGDWVMASNIGTANPGSHPVGDDVTLNGATGTDYGGSSPVTIAPEMSVAYDNAVAGWDLGGHLTASGGVTCVSCHAVHGVEADSGGVIPAIADTVPQGNFLAFWQASVVQDTGLTPARNIHNGDGDFNELCEACHSGTTPDPAYTHTPGDYPGGTFANPNPGGTAFGHPVDTMDAAAAFGVSAFTTGWAVGDAGMAGSNVAPVPICESCHVAHPAANTARTNDQGIGDFANSDYILRDEVSIVCNGCHTGTAASGNQHHPVGIVYNATGAALSGLPTDLPAAGATLSCGTCHGGSGASVHNWTSFGQDGFALNSNWNPANNARDAAQANDYMNTEMSIECILCHYAADGGTDKNPAMTGTGLLYNAANETHFDYIGEGTHYVGVIQETWANLSGTLYDGTNLDTAVWTAAYGGNGGWSRWGDDNAGGTVVVCESCHELEPDKNAGPSTHLLLANFAELDIASADTRDSFCEGCHLPGNTHPMTGDLVTDPTSGTSRALITDQARLHLTPPTDGNVFMGDGNDILSCDNCHQAHSANTNSGTFILDTAPANVGTPIGLNTTGMTGDVYTASEVTDQQTGIGGNHQSFCAECHPYFD